MARTKVTQSEVKPPVFTTPTLASGWTSFDTGPIPNTSGTDTWRFPRYTKDASGIVHLSGLIVNNSGGTVGTNVTMFTLPSGFRPGHTLMFSVPKAISGGEGFGNIFVKPTGEVALFGGSTSLTNGQWASLSPISFVAEQ